MGLSVRFRVAARAFATDERLVLPALTSSAPLSFVGKAAMPMVPLLISVDC